MKGIYSNGKRGMKRFLRDYKQLLNYEMHFFGATMTDWFHEQLHGETNVSNERLQQLVSDWHQLVLVHHRGLSPQGKMFPFHETRFAELTQAEVEYLNNMKPEDKKEAMEILKQGLGYKQPGPKKYDPLDPNLIKNINDLYQDKESKRLLQSVLKEIRKNELSRMDAKTIFYGEVYNQLYSNGKCTINQFTENNKVKGFPTKNSIYNFSANYKNIANLDSYKNLSKHIAENLE